MNWFEEWFDSPLYEKLYADRDEEEAEQLIEFLESTLSLDNSFKILDLGCGRGRHAINLAKKGYHIKGIDLSEESIKVARKRAEEAGLNRVEFEVRDMREPLPEKFDAILNLFTTFGYFEDDKENSRVLDTVAKMLKPDGVFVLDYLNAEKVRTDFVPSEEGNFQGIYYEIERYVDENAIHKDIVFTGDPIDGKKSYSERVKLYDLSWFRRQMGKRGLIVDNVFGDYEGGEFDPQSSPRLIIVSRLKQQSHLKL